jgi:histone H3/H4
MADLLVVRSKVKEYAKKKKMRFGEEAILALNKEVATLIDKAIERAKGSKRGTVQGRDI